MGDPGPAVRAARPPRGPRAPLTWMALGAHCEQRLLLYKGFKRAQNFHMNGSSKEPQGPTGTYKSSDAHGWSTATKTPRLADHVVGPVIQRRAGVSPGSQETTCLGRERGGFG